MVHQFEMYFTNEYLENIVADFAAVLNLEYDEKDVEIASEGLSVHGLENVLLLKRTGCLLCIDCNARACLKNAFCQMCVTVCGRFVPNEGGVVGYVN